MSKSKEKKPTPKYSDYGLDDVKRSQDKGGKGMSFCLWTDSLDENLGGYGHNVEKGFNLCFQHFCICPECIQKSFLPENAYRWVMDPYQCFKCRKKDLACYQEYDFERRGAGLGICRECMEWAAKVLGVEIVKEVPAAKQIQKEKKYDRQRQAQQSLFPDQGF